MSAPVKTLLALAVVALAQTAVLASMVIDRVLLLRTGREIVLPIVPVDPRDFFRGEYVRLSYGINIVPMTPAALHRNETVYVVLEKKTADEDWQVASAARGLPGDLNPDQIALKGRFLWGNTVHYGIENCFVPQGEGARIEELARNRKLTVLVAVDKAGNAAIKGLIVDGKVQYEERPL